MPQALLNSARKFKIYMTDSADPTAGKEGLSSFDVLLAKDNAAEVTVSPTIVERGQGWYEVTPLAAHRDTLGESAWTFQHAGANDFARLEEVVVMDLQDVIRLGITALPNAESGASGGLFYTIAFETDQILQQIAALQDMLNAGGNVSVDSFTANALQQLAAIKIVLMALLDQKTKTLTLVQNKDYTSTSVIGPVRFKIEQAGVAEGDAVRLGFTLSSGESRDVNGVVVDDAGTLYGEVELTKELHTNVPADDYGKYEFEHISGSGEVSPLLPDKKLIVLPAHPN